MNEVAERLAARDKIAALETVMRTMAPLVIEPRHYFGTDCYVREVTLPAGTTATGKIHKTRHVCIISKGDVTVVTETGSQRIAAPATFISEPGTKRAVYAHEDTVWTTIHGTPETDIAKLEADLVVDDFDALEAAGAPCLS